MRGATRRAAQGARQSRFQSTPLMRGATVRGYCPGDERRVSIHAPHARGDGRRGPRTAGRDVSIHAPHARGDHARVHGGHPLIVSIHAPHARGDRTWSRRLPIRGGFNPRPSCEGRQGHCKLLQRDTCFNPRPSCEGRRERAVADAERPAVSIHAPHARGDLRGLARPASEPVSIHAPHARGDDEGAVGHRPVQVSIHAPHARGDGTAYYLPDRSNVSIHAPHARGDRCLPFSTSQTTRFNPRPSCEGRRVWQAAVKR